MNQFDNSKFIAVGKCRTDFFLISRSKFSGKLYNIYKHQKKYLFNLQLRLDKQVQKNESIGFRRYTFFRSYTY